MSKRFPLIFLTVAVMLTLVGCSKPPEAEMQAANAAFDAARGAEAEAYVPDVYRAAMDTLNAAMAMKQEQDGKFALFRSYGKSKEVFLKSEGMAKQVAMDAAAEKERVKARVTELLTQARAALDSTTAALAKAPRGKGSKAEVELMKSDLGAAEASFTDAQNDFNAGKYLSAQSKVQAVVDRAHKLSDEIAMAWGKKK